MRVVPRVAEVVAQVARRHRSEVSPVDYLEIARWGRWLARADAAAGHLAAFRASSFYGRLGPRAGRLFDFAYMGALHEHLAACP